MIWGVGFDLCVCGGGPGVSHGGCWLGHLRSQEVHCLGRLCEEGVWHSWTRIEVFTLEEETHQLHAWGALERAA